MLFSFAPFRFSWFFVSSSDSLPWRKSKNVRLDFFSLPVHAACSVDRISSRFPLLLLLLDFFLMKCGNGREGKHFNGGKLYFVAPPLVHPQKFPAACVSAFLPAFESVKQKIRKSDNDFPWEEEKHKTKKNSNNCSDKKYGECVWVRGEGKRNKVCLYVVLADRGGWITQQQQPRYTYIHRQSKGTQYSQKEGERKSRFFKCLSRPHGPPHSGCMRKDGSEEEVSARTLKKEKQWKKCRSRRSQKQATEIEGPLISFRPSFLPHSRFLGGHQCPSVREKRKEKVMNYLSEASQASTKFFFEKKYLWQLSRGSLKANDFVSETPLAYIQYTVCYSTFLCKLQHFILLSSALAPPPCTEAAAAAEGAGEEDRGRHRTTTPPLWGRRTEMR